MVIDESKFGKLKYHRGHRVEGQWVLGMEERTVSRRMVFIPVEKRDSHTLKEITKKYVHPESIIYTDCWWGYNGLEKNFKGHQTVNHRRFFKDLVTLLHTNT